MMQDNLIVLILSLTATTFAIEPPPVIAQSAPRQIVKIKDNLPQFSYAISGTATDLVRAPDATFAPFAAKVKADIDAVLARYEIRDIATLRELYSTRLSLQLLEGKNDDALATIGVLRGLSEKPSEKLLTGLSSMAIARARLSTGQITGVAYAKAFGRNLAKSLETIPWSVVGNGVKQRRGDALIASDDNMLGLLQAYIEPGVAKTHQLSREGAAYVIGARLFVRYQSATVPQELAALTAYITAHDVPKRDIWPAREVNLTAADGLNPVPVAIWDVGVDLSQFPTQTFVDPTPGTSSDPHGIAYDINFRPTHGDLKSLTPAQQRGYAASLEDAKGMSDLEASIESPEADGWRRKLARLSPSARAALMESTYFYGNYTHGTHVAGIAASGNPAIRLATARATWDWHNIPIAFTDAVIARQVAAYQHYVDWFRTRHIRVVNMSWGEAPSDFESNLETNGIGKDTADRKAIARRLFERERDGLRRAMASAPDVLFITAAGNSNDDNGFTEDIPSSFDMPNVLTVGAVDQAGEEASFTTFGKLVRVHASGYQVESVVPGGLRLRFTGTSMAAPAVVNLAAKMLALDPALTPPEVVRMIIAGADTSADGRLHVINPKAAIGMLPQRR
jgi:subtilisin family serine protease